MSGFRFRHQLGLDEDCVCMVCAAQRKSSEVDGYWNGSSGNSRFTLLWECSTCPCENHV
jgi:hypothetical protein